MTLFTRTLVAGLMLSLLATLIGGLARWMVAWPVAETLRTYHGPLICGLVFPGLIGLERAVALGRPWAWAAPVLALLGLAATLFRGDAWGGWWLLVAAVFLAEQAALNRRSPGLDGQLGVLAGLALALADGLWLTERSTQGAATAWATFLILVIAAERLELSFLARSAGRVARVVSLLLLAGALFGRLELVGWAWVVLALWLGRHDLARRNARRSGLPAFCARAVLLGYLWLALSGLQLALWGERIGAFDRVYHGVFVGFVLSMVMAHGPIIFPALLGLPMRFSGLFYLPLLLLHGSLAWRCWGDPVRGGQGNVLGFVVFLLLAAWHLGGQERPWLRPDEKKSGPRTIPEA